MPNARKIIFGTYVVPTQSIEGEETGVRHTEYVSTVNKSLGGKGTVTINATQWGDKWSSSTHPFIQNWEEFDSVNWEDVLIHPGESGKITVSTSAIQLSTDSNDCDFLYIKNLGELNNATYNDEVLVSLEGSGGKYYIIIPPQGALSMRGDGSNLECNEVYVKCASGKTTQIEYLIAKE